MSAQSAQHNFNHVACTVPNRSLLFSSILAQKPPFNGVWPVGLPPVFRNVGVIRGFQVPVLRTKACPSPSPGPSPLSIIPRDMILFWLYSKFLSPFMLCIGQCSGSSPLPTLLAHGSPRDGFLDLPIRVRLPTLMYSTDNRCS